MTSTERMLFRQSALVGCILTVMVLAFDAFGLLNGLEKWLYDRRVRDCQYFRKPPTTQLVHIDIDDRSLEAVGKWPWPRDTIATILEEIGRAGPKVVGTDIVFSEPAPIRTERLPDNKSIDIDEDAAMVRALSQMNNVVLPTSLLLAPPKSVTKIETALRQELIADLEISQEKLASHLKIRGFSSDEVRESVGESFFRARREAMYQRLLNETAHGPLSMEELYKRLLPVSYGSIADSALFLHSPLQRVLHDELDRVQAFRELERFALPPQESAPKALATVPNALPLTSYMHVARSAGFADDSLTEPIVRSMPMFVECNGQIFPQWGLAFACALADGDLKRAHLSAGSVVVPTLSGELKIPLRFQRSATVNRDVPFIADIPWFGTSDWRTMYDYPKHQDTIAHLAIGFVWEICSTREFIRKNNRVIDQAVFNLLDEPTEQQMRLGLDASAAKRYRDALPLLEDPASREQVIQQTEKILADSGFGDAIKAIPQNERKPEEVAAFHVYTDAPQAMHAALEKNRQLAVQLDKWRTELRTSLQNKGVLIGWTATGAVDMVTTPLHARCPGVVVHGAITNAVLTGDWLRTAPMWVTMLLTMFLGLAIAFSTSWFSPSVGVMTAMVTAVLYFLMNGVLLFDWGRLIVGAAGPLFAVGLVWSGCTVARLIFEIVERVRIDKEVAVFRHEMDLAKNVQQALIPKSEEMPVIAGVEPFGWTKAADETGGDLFDLWTLPDGRLGILVADASGHGIAPAVIVSQVRTLVRALSDIETHPNPLLARVNARLAQDLEPARFVTCFLGFLNSEGQLDWASAGHGPMLWCAKDGDEFQSLDATALPLGIMPDYMGDEIPPLQLDLGGMLVVTSDGIFEAPDKTDEQFGIERVIETLKNYSGKTAVEIVFAIRDAVTKWQRDPDKPVDDQTTVLIRRVAAGTSVTIVESGNVATAV